MTDIDWLTCTNPDDMLRTGRGTWPEREKIFKLVYRQIAPTLEEEAPEILQLMMVFCHRKGWGIRAKDHEENTSRLAMVRCLIPFRRIRFKKQRTETVLALAKGIDTGDAFDRMPILADALEELGADPLAVEHCRHGQHWQGCWVIEELVRPFTSPE